MQIAFLIYAVQTLIATIISIAILYRWNSNFTFIKNVFIRGKLRILIITCSFYAAFQPGNYGWHKMGQMNKVVLYGGYVYMSLLSIVTAILFEQIAKLNWYKQQKGVTKNVITFIVIGFVPMITEFIIAPLVGFKQNELIANISFTFWASCLAATIYLFFQNYTSTQALALQQKELDIAKLNQLNLQANLEALQSKINPHFLYNSMSAMAGLALEDGAKTSKMAIALSKLFRYNLNKEYNNLATVQEEVDMAEIYLTIEKIRFEERLDYSFNVSNDAKLFNIPRFVLQPLVENCIKHGFNNNNTTGKIEVAIASVQNTLIIDVADNGNPFSENMQLGYGLQSLHQKLQLLFAKQHTIEITNNPKKISITINYATHL